MKERGGEWGCAQASSVSQKLPVLFNFVNIHHKCPQAAVRVRSAVETVGSLSPAPCRLLLLLSDSRVGGALLLINR